MGSLAGHHLLQLAAFICLQCVLQATDHFVCESANGTSLKPFPYIVNVTEEDTLSDRISHCNRIIYNLTEARMHEWTDNPSLLVSVYSKSRSWGFFRWINSLKLINRGYATHVYLVPEQVWKYRYDRYYMSQSLDVCPYWMMSWCKYEFISISFQIIIPKFTMIGPELTLLTEMEDGLRLLWFETYNIDESSWAFRLLKNSEASRRVPLLSFMARNWGRHMSSYEEDNYKLLEGPSWAPALLKKCDCGKMREDQCWQAVRMNFSRTEMDVTFGPDILSGRLCRKITLEFGLVDTCSRYENCDGRTRVKLILELSNAGM